MIDPSRVEIADATRIRVPAVEQPDDLTREDLVAADDQHFLAAQVEIRFGRPWLDCERERHDEPAWRAGSAFDTDLATHQRSEPRDHPDCQRLLLPGRPAFIRLRPRRRSVDIDPQLHRHAIGGAVDRVQGHPYAGSGAEGDEMAGQAPQDAPGRLRRTAYTAGQPRIDAPAQFDPLF